MILTIHAGHNPDGKTACGASGIIRESTEARIVKDKILKTLRAAGHTVYDVTVEDGSSQSDILDRLVTRCNSREDARLHLSVHFNAGGKRDDIGDGVNKGSEVLVYGRTSRAFPFAEAVLEHIGMLGYHKRGVKERPDLAFLRRTKAPALLVECCFVDDVDDIRLYSPETMAGAVSAGIQQAAGETAKEPGQKPDDKPDQTPCFEAAENHNMSNEAFIRYIGSLAQIEWSRTKRVLPSTVVAQALLEASKDGRFGQSELARRACNLFGLKAHSGVWKGRVYEKATGECYDGKNYVSVQALFRAYESWRESVADHSAYLSTRSLDGQRTLLYAPVIGNPDYRSACISLKACGYATGIGYDTKLIRLIERYGLNRYDEVLVAEALKRMENPSFMEELAGGKNKTF